MTGEKDIVLIYYEDKPMSFARIERIDEDVKRGWYRVKLFLLQLPLQSVTWILRDTYIDGSPFTMGGKQMRLEKVTCPEDPAPAAPDDPAGSKSRGPGTAQVIDLKDLKKK